MAILLGLAATGLLMTVTTAHPADRPLADWMLEVRPDGVRTTILVNFQFIDTVLGQEADPRTPPTGEELARIRRRLEKAFAERNRVEINGNAVSPRFVSFESAPPPPELIEREPDYGRRMTQVRWIIDYATPKVPTSLALTWDFYPPHAIYDLPDSPKAPLKVNAVLVAGGKTSVLAFRADQRVQEVRLQAEAPPARDHAQRSRDTGRDTGRAWALLAAITLVAGMAFARSKRLLALALLMFGLVSCGETSPAVGPSEVGTANWIVRVEPRPAITVNKHFSIAVSVHAKDGSTALPAKVRVDADMPCHGHGMNTLPKLTSLGAGQWLAEGMLCHMPGHWELYVYVGEGESLERAIVPVQL